MADVAKTQEETAETEQKLRQKVFQSLRTGANQSLRGAKAVASTGKKVAKVSGKVVGGGAVLGAAGLYRGITSGSIALLFFWCLGTHLFDAYWLNFNPNSVGLRVAIWSFVWFLAYGILKPANVTIDPRTLLQTGVLSAVSFMIPHLKGWLDIVFPSAIGNFIVVWAPIWIIYILYFIPEVPGWIHKVGIVYMLFWLALVIWHGYQIGFFERIAATATGEINVVQPVVTVWEMVKEGSIAIWHGAWEIPKKYNQSRTDFLRYATGQDLYTAEVDKNAKEKLGVHLENVQKSQPDYYTSDPVSVWATIVAKTFDKPMQISINCIADKGKEEEKRADYLYPAGVYEVSISDEEDLDCSFKAKSFKKGSHRISLMANFTFQTMSYQKTYLVDRSRAVALAREKIDILDYYGVEDKKPKAVYTSGPVMIGMDIRNMPIKLNRELGEDALFTLGVSIKNQWQGRIVNLTKLQLIFPYFSELVDLKCGSDEYQFTQAERGVYDLTTTLGPIKTYHSLRCQVRIPTSSFDDVLGQTPISIQFFKATAEYVYEFEKTVSVTVKETEEEKAQREATKATAPTLSIQPQKMAKGDAIFMYLPNFASDAETKNDSLTFRLVSQSNPSVVECVLENERELRCRAKDIDGTSDITIEVNDGARTTTKKFTITVGTGGSSGGSGGGTSGTADHCKELDLLKAGCGSYMLQKGGGGTCMTACKYWRGCKGNGGPRIGDDWDCVCSADDLTKIGDANYRKGFCPGSDYCCNPDCVGCTGKTSDECTVCQNCYWEDLLDTCRSYDDPILIPP